MDSTRENWRRLRTLRAAPPDSMPASRHGLFCSALEQAEQQCSAAAAIGYESRALNLYYGLSQAGRAIAAALTPNGTGRSPEVRGHGLAIPGLNAARADSLFGLEVFGDGDPDSSFGRLAELLSSDPLTTGVPFAAAWTMLPELSLDHPMGDFPQPRFTGKRFSPDRTAIDPNTFTIQATAEEMSDESAVLIARYPDLARARLESFGGSSYGATEDGTRTDEAFFVAIGAPCLRRLRGSLVLMPAWRPGVSSLDPLLAWWAVLYTLSMVTRYKPVEWTKLIDVNKSTAAVPIETALDKALEAIPAQLVDTLCPSPVG